MKFNELSLIPPLLQAVGDAGYSEPSPIQQKSIPPVLAGRDLLGCAQTGTGKTAAFALPILQLLMAHNPQARSHKREKKDIRVLVLTPTRELALQIDENFQQYSKHLPLRSTVIFGGVGQAPQVQKLRQGVDILVATPGRLNDLIGQGHIKLDTVEIFVLDEADRMLDMGFYPDVKKVIRLLPQKRQTLLFSATMPDEIIKLADSLLTKPAKVFVTPVSSTVEMIEQQLYKVDKKNKRFLLAQLVQKPDVVNALVFTRTKHGADRVVRELGKEKIQAMAIHGNKSQNARQQALKLFKEGKIKVLVATDIAARGIDISGLSYVFNYDLPNIPETYVHRIGRTGRAGRDGIAVSFCCYDELPYLADIQRLIGFTIREITGHQWPLLQTEPTEKPAQDTRQGKQTQPQRKDKANGPKPAPKQAAAARQNNNGKPRPQSNKPAPLADTSANTGKETAKPKAPARANRAETAAANMQEVQQHKKVTAPTSTQTNRRKGSNRRPAPYDPYDNDNRTGGKTIVTKRPIWGSSGETLAETTAKSKEGDLPMSRNNSNSNNNKRKNSKSMKRPVEEKKAPIPEIRKDENGVFDFSEAELAEDKGLQVVSRGSNGTKYANFEDFLKDH